MTTIQHVRICWLKSMPTYFSSEGAVDVETRDYDEKRVAERDGETSGGDKPKRLFSLFNGGLQTIALRRNTSSRFSCSNWRHRF